MRKSTLAMASLEAKVCRSPCHVYVSPSRANADRGLLAQRHRAGERGPLGHAELGLGCAGAAAAPSRPDDHGAHLHDALAPAKDAAQAIGMEVVEAEKLLGALASVIRGPHAARPAALAPGHAPQGLSSRGPHSSKEITAARRGHVW